MLEKLIALFKRQPKRVLIKEPSMKIIYNPFEKKWMWCQLNPKKRIWEWQYSATEEEIERYVTAQEKAFVEKHLKEIESYDALPTAPPLTITEEKDNG